MESLLSGGVLGSEKRIAIGVGIPGVGPVAVEQGILSVACPMVTAGLRSILPPVAGGVFWPFLNA